jgi:hypothetical protein
LNALLLSTVLILMNLEEHSLGCRNRPMANQISLLGLGVVFGVMIYTRSQALLFSGNAGTGQP